MALEMWVVGAGECFREYYLPINEELTRDGVARITTAVDVLDAPELNLPKGMRHIKRQYPDQPLSDLIGTSKPDIIIITEPNTFHVPDAKDLVENGHRVLIEKPYATSAAELNTVEGLLETGKLGLIEYYLFGKTAVLQILAGTVQPDSFYFRKPGLLTGDVTALQMNAGRLMKIIGNITSIDTVLLEGQGTTGSVMHRNDELSVRPGSGMIHDIGIHALSPVIGLLGKVTMKEDTLDLAVCEEHLKHYLAKGYSRDEISETYAQVELTSETGIPVVLRTGKYALGWGPNTGRNERLITINGTRGRVEMDTTTRIMKVFENNSEEPTWTVGNAVNPRYYGALRTAVEQPLTLTRFALEAQKTILTLAEAAQKRYAGMPTYKSGAEVSEINKLFSAR